MGCEWVKMGLDEGWVVCGEIDVENGGVGGLGRSRAAIRKERIIS